MTRPSVEARAERFQRRQTGPWQTALQHLGPVDLTYRYRRRRRIEWARLDVAWHDLWVHAILRPLGRGRSLPLWRRSLVWFLKELDW